MRLCAHWSWCFNPGLRQIQRHRAAPKPRCLGDFESWSSSLWVLYKSSQWPLPTRAVSAQLAWVWNIFKLTCNDALHHVGINSLPSSCSIAHATLDHTALELFQKLLPFSSIFAIWQVAAVQRQYQRDAVDFFFNNAEKVPPVHSGSDNMPNFLWFCRLILQQFRSPSLASSPESC